VLDSASEVVSYQLNPLPQQLGQKYQARYPAIREVLLGLDAGEVAPYLLDGESLCIDVEGEQLDILPTEVEVLANALPGFVFATEGAFLVALMTEITPALFQEGIARELVHVVQELRKQDSFDITDRIHLYIQASEELSEAASTHREYIMNETLAVEIHEGEVPEGTTTSVKISGGEVHIGIVKAV
jgi:isoleucyl-tRNA synthetase